MARVDRPERSHTHTFIIGERFPQTQLNVRGTDSSALGSCSTTHSSVGGTGSSSSSPKYPGRKIRLHSQIDSKSLVRSVEPESRKKSGPSWVTWSDLVVFGVNLAKQPDIQLQ